jgi:hypothetical protein
VSSLLLVSSRSRPLLAQEREGYIMVVMMIVRSRCGRGPCCCCCISMINQRNDRRPASGESGGGDEAPTRSQHADARAHCSPLTQHIAPRHRNQGWHSYTCDGLARSTGGSPSAK